VDRNIKSEVSRWIKSPDSKRFLEEFRKFEEENFEAGRIPKQKDIERFQEAKVPLVGEIRHPFGKVLQFPLRKRRFKVNAFLKKLFFDFPYIKFVPGIVHYQSERIYPDDYEALRFLKGSLRILKNLCLSAIGEGQIEEQRFLSSDLAGTFICTGGPVSNAISRIAMQYERKERDPTKGFLRTTEPIIQLRYEPVYDVEYVLSEAGYMVRFIDDKAHRAPNWFIRDIRSGELLKPAKHKKDDVDDVLATDFLLISILPNILDRESYERGDKIQIFGGTHGVGTRAVELVCSDSSLIERITGLVGKLPYWQVLLEINAIDHREGQSRPISLRNDIRWCEVTINEAKLDEWFGKDRLFGKSSRRSDVIKSGKESSTTETCSSEDQAESQGGGSKEFSSDHHQPKDTLSPWEVGGLRTP
jgi:hypothetical protein